jgi:hypothetical protein
VFIGLVQSKNDQEVLLKDAQSKTIRVAGDNLASIIQERISMMPELVLKDVTAQDAADLLAYLESLQTTQPEKK